MRSDPVSGMKYFPQYRKIDQPRRSITDEMIHFIHSLLEENLTRPKKQRMTGRQIHDKMIQTGYSIGYSTVREIIADWNKSHASREVYILPDPEPGYRAEFDWCQVSLQIHGVWTKVSMAVMVLTWSLFRFARLYCHETQQEVIDAHIQFFNEIQSVPRYIYYNNIRAVYDCSRKKFRKPTFNLHPNTAIPMKSIIQFLPMKRVQMKRVSVLSGRMHSERGTRLNHLKKLNNG